MQRNLISETKDLIGKEVDLFGWVTVRRDHGKIIFIDLRDRTGSVQVVFGPWTKDLYKPADQLRPEWVIHVRGNVKERPENMINPDLETGKVEIEPTELEVLNEAETPPFPIDTDGKEVGEESRMKYRYIDLRRERMSSNLKKRHETILFARNWLNEKGFLEVETPIITKSTPEGARDFIVPSRLYPGKFYALPQAPQQYKQLLMVSGVENYFQFARCFRDEDTRGDRQPEFTQLDMETSFVSREEVMELNEKLLIDIVQKVYPEKKIQEIPFPQLTHKEAMEKYNTDRPDLRKDKDDPSLLAFCWIVDFPFFEKNDDGGWTFTHNPFSAPKIEFVDDLLSKKNIGEILTSQYDVALNGFEIGGGSIRSHKPEMLKATLEIIGLKDKEIEENFGHMLKALGFGAPPHGGIAWGFDRLMAVLQNEPNIREVIAFPKTGDARDLMMDSPAEVGAKQLRELHLKVGK